MNNTKVMKAIVQVCGSVDPSLGKMVSSTEKSLGKINLKAAAVSAAVVAGIGVAAKELYDFGKASVENASTFQSEMQNVATLLDGTESEVSDRISEMQQEILSVSNMTGVATSELSDGMYQVVSAFGDSADSIGILETAAKSASAGNATTTESINLLSAVTKAYGDTSTDAVKKASDLAFETVKLGQTTYPELAASMGKVTSMSSTLGVSQEELFGVFATATGVVGGAAEVSTQLKSVYTKLQKPTEDMAKAMDELGYSNAQAMIDNLGLQGSLEALTDYSDKTGVSLAKLYGSSEAANLATALTGNLEDNLTDKTKAMQEAAGMTETAFGRQEQSIEAVEEKIKNLGENFKTQVGLAILPMVQNLAEEALPMIADAIDVLAPVLEALFTDVLTQATPLLEAIFPQLIEIMEELTPVIGEVLTALMPLVTEVIGDIMPILMQLIRLALPVVSQLLTALMPIIQQLVDGPLGALFNAILGLMSDAAGPLATVISFLAAMFTERLSGAMQAIMPIVNAVLSVFTNVINFVTNVFAGNWSAAWQNVVNIFSGIFSAIGGIVKYPLNQMISGINSFIAGINSIKIPDWVPGVGGKSLNISKIPMLAAGGFTNGPSIAGEVPGQTEAVISFLPQFRDKNIEIWQKAGMMLGVNEQQSTPLQLAGQLTALDDFSLADMGATTIIYYDFSNFEYHPEFNSSGNSNKEKSFMQELEENKYEFADWFLEWISVVTQED